MYMLFSNKRNDLCSSFCNITGIPFLFTFFICEVNGKLTFIVHIMKMIMKKE